jgi:AAA domain
MVISEYDNNEGADYLKRSLLERLFAAGYPAVTLRENYQNHPHILKLVKSKVYGGVLVSAPLQSPSAEKPCYLLVSADGKNLIG